MTDALPDLSTYTVEQASFLATAMRNAGIRFKQDAVSYRDIARAGGSDRWISEHEALAKQAAELRDTAADWAAAAEAQCRIANRERCIAIRMIEAFAQACGAGDRYLEAAE